MAYWHGFGLQMLLHLEVWGNRLVISIVLVVVGVWQVGPRLSLPLGDDDLLLRHVLNPNIHHGNCSDHAITLSRESWSSEGPVAIAHRLNSLRLVLSYHWV